MQRFAFPVLVFVFVAYALVLLDHQLTRWLLQDVALGTPYLRVWILRFIAGP